MKNIPIQKFAKDFNEEYNFLYEHGDSVAGYSEALETFENTLKENDNFKNFVAEFSQYRGDFISSDREAVAFMFTLEKYM